MSLEDLFQKNLCICEHSINEEHLENGTCYALDFNGSIYSACRCIKAIPMKLSFKIEREYEVPVNIKKAIPKSTTKPIQQPKSFIVFGGKKL